VVMTTAAAGPFDRLMRLVRRGLGGAVGDGRQFVSWIHPRDFVRAIEWLIEHEELEGPVNIAAPQPLPNRDFMRGMREAWGIRFGLPVPFKWMMEIGAFFMLESGFHFDFPEWPAAARDLVAAGDAHVYPDGGSPPHA
jgi:NAD dependent epimerase/dehydratase family enzyme